MPADKHREERPDISFTSPGEDSDAVLSPEAEPELLEPLPGLNGAPVRCE